MNVYLAARYSRRVELNHYRNDLARIGFTVTSRWINGNHQVADQSLSSEADPEERERFAVEDWQDLMDADICISFTEAPRATASRGGRHVEFGAALAAGKTCLVVGHRENVFHCLPGVAFFETWDACLENLNVLIQ